jgi:hypothetical protein
VKLRYTYFLFKNERTDTIDEHPVCCVDPTTGGAKEIVEKKKVYAEYHGARDEMRELLVAKSNVDRLLNITATRAERENSHAETQPPSAPHSRPAGPRSCRRNAAAITGDRGIPPGPRPGGTTLPRVPPPPPPRRSPPLPSAPYSARRLPAF